MFNQLYKNTTIVLVSLGVTLPPVFAQGSCPNDLCARNIVLNDGIHYSNQESYIMNGQQSQSLFIEVEGDFFEPGYGIKATGGANILINQDQLTNFTTNIVSSGKIADGIIAGRLGALTDTGLIVDYIDEEGSRYAGSTVTIYGSTHISSATDDIEGVSYGLRIIGDGANINLLSTDLQMRSSIRADGTAIRYDYGNGYSVNFDGSSAQNKAQTINLENVDLIHRGKVGIRELDNDNPDCVIIAMMCDGVGYNTQTDGHLIEVGNHNVEAGRNLIDGETTMTVANAVKNGVLNLYNSTATAVANKDLLHVTYGGGTKNTPNKVSSNFTLNAYNNTVLHGSIFTDNTIDFEGKKSTTQLNLDHSQWIIPRDSNVTNLNLSNNSEVYIGGDQRQAITEDNQVLLQVDYLTGAGNFYVRTDIVSSGLTSNNISDQLHVLVEGQGSHTIFVTDHNTGGLVATGKEQVLLAKIKSGDAIFGLGNHNGYVDLGAYKYGLKKEINEIGEQDWILVASSTIDPNPDPDPKLDFTNTANNSINILNINYMMNSIEGGIIYDRIGFIKEHGHLSSVWAKGYGGQFNSIKTNLQKFDLNYHGIMIGADHMAQGSQGDIYFGAFAGYSDGTVKYKKQSQKGSVNSYSLGAYGGFKSNDGLYVDGFLKYMNLHNTFNAQTGFGYTVSGKNRNKSYGGSIQLGRVFYISDSEQGWYLNPSSQLSYTHFNSATVRATNGLTTHLKSMDSLIGSVFLETGYRIKDADTVIDFNIGIGYSHEFGGKSGYRFNQDLFFTQHNNKQQGWNSQLGFNVKFNNQHDLALNLQHTAGRQFNQFNLSVGYKFNF